MPLVRFAMRWPQHSFAAASLLDTISARFKRDDRSFWRRGVMYVGLFHPSSRWPFPHVASGPDPLALQPPMVLVSVHLGAVEAVGALLEHLPAEVLIFVDREVPPSGSVRTVALGANEWQRAAATKRAVETLRAGGFVFLALDGQSTGARIHETISGERVSWARGGFDLARLTASPMVPVMTRWRGRKVEIVAGEPIPPGDGPTMAATLARWLESYLSDGE